MNVKTIVTLFPTIVSVLFIPFHLFSTPLDLEKVLAVLAISLILTAIITIITTLLLHKKFNHKVTLVVPLCLLMAEKRELFIAEATIPDYNILLDILLGLLMCAPLISFIWISTTNKANVHSNVILLLMLDSLLATITGNTYTVGCVSVLWQWY